EGLTARQYIDFIADVFEVSIEDRKARIAKYAEVFNLTDKLDDRISTFSHGMKQKVSVISALVHEPDVFILDEPMLGLDPAATFELKKIMLEYASQGKVVFFSSHILDVVEKLCTRIGIIDGGKLVAVCDMQELKEKRSDMSLENLFLNLTKREDNE
ncbi:MAG: ABC transporter ATP-binding protein, partial [Clostridia bacterium]|nr:ABC transporter ATP-binding protein [Clostridia bacterium]